MILHLYSELLVYHVRGRFSGSRQTRKYILYKWREFFCQYKYTIIQVPDLARGMEFASTKRSRNRRKKRNVRKRRRERIKFEVRTVKSQRFVTECSDDSFCKERVIMNTMQADAFWKNYVAAQEWQKRHSVAWWRSRCVALEHENEILRNKIRSLSGQNKEQVACKQWQNVRKENDHRDDESEKHELRDDEDLEFHVDADMMTFLEQSIRHKIELKQQRELELAAKEEEIVVPMEGGAVWARTRSEGAKLLYGDASPTILAMETALQATVDRHKDKSKPRYWPNIPFRP